MSYYIGINKKNKNMKHIRMFENAEQAAAILPTLEYNTLSAIRGESGISLKPGVLPPDPRTFPFYIENVSGSENIVSIIKSSDNAPTLTIEKSTDGETWESMGSTSTTAITATIPINSKLYLRCNTTSWGNAWNGENDINTTGDCNLGGNIMSLLYGSNFTGNEATFPSGSTHTFHGTFNSNSHIINSSNLVLPSTTMTDDCYVWMFKGCTSLASAPVLPATTLASECYRQMFDGCTSLVIAPELPATTLAPNCYSSMFQGCTALTTAPTLHAMTLAQNCYQAMFDGCTSLTTAPALPAMTLDYGCYFSMFRNCSSLTTAPELPATTLTERCYAYMFKNCTSLSSAPELPATTMTTQCYYQMFYGCTSLTTAPDLLAATLVDRCYAQMFYNCTNLNYIKCLATNKSSTYSYTSEWVNGVASVGTFVKDPSMTGWSTGSINGIPSGWTVQDAA